MAFAGALFRGIALGAILLLSFSPRAYAQQPTLREYPTLYKSPRAMGMGGAYTAVGGRVDALFYNPAGLINIPEDKGWEVNLIKFGAEYSKNGKDFVDDLSDALDVSEENGARQKAVNDVLSKYSGKALHAGVSDFTSIGKRYDTWAFGVGGIGNGNLTAVAHQGMGADGFLEVDADAVYGGIGGVSVELRDNVIGGIGVKYLHRETLMHNFSALDIVNNQDNLDDYIEKDLRRKGNAFGIDAGVIWKFAPDSLLEPSLGISVMNIGDLDFGNAGKIPQTVNVGLSVNPDIDMFRSLVVAVDYIDVLNNYKQDKDIAKRLRYGAELQLFDEWPAELALRAGMYEGSPTFGADLRLLIVTLTYTMYTEELGAYAGQNKDKRNLLTLNVGW